MKTKLAVSLCAVAALLAGCAVSTVNKDLATAQNVCATAAPADVAAATQAAPNNAAVAKVATVATGACAAVNDAASNVGVVDSVVSFVDNLFGVSAGTAAPSTAAPASN